MTTINGQNKARNAGRTAFTLRETSSKGTDGRARRPQGDRFDTKLSSSTLEQRLSQSLGAQGTPDAGAPVILAPATVTPEGMQQAIMALKLPGDAYNAEVRVNGQLAVNAAGDVKAESEAGYYAQSVRAVLRGESSIKLQDRSDDLASTTYRLAGGVSITLGPRIRSSDAAAVQNKVLSDLQTLAGQADRWVGRIGRSTMTADQKETALEGVGDQLSGALLRGLLVAQNTEKGVLPRGLVDRLSLSMGGLVSANDPFAELDKRYAAIGRQNPFPRTATDAVMNAADAVRVA